MLYHSQATKADTGKYVSEFTFQMASITADKSSTYKCELNFNPPNSITVEVRIMGMLIKKSVLYYVDSDRYFSFL
jgi:hypothetical protein